MGEFVWTPAEIFRETFHIEPHDLTVIIWILPQTKATRADNRLREHIIPSLNQYHYY
jgi:epoxyqueuosine reductase